MLMDKAQIIIAAILFFSLATTAFILTLIEFVNMDKNPDKYRNPRYVKKSGKLKSHQIHLMHQLQIRHLHQKH